MQANILTELSEFIGVETLITIQICLLEKVEELINVVNSFGEGCSAQLVEEVEKLYVPVHHFITERLGTANLNLPSHLLNKSINMDSR
jgi:hypothetical protein